MYNFIQLIFDFPYMVFRTIMRLIGLQQENVDQNEQEQEVFTFDDDPDLYVGAWSQWAPEVSFLSVQLVFNSY